MGHSKILIIDDDPDITEAMRIVLDDKGYEVITASDGTEGMEQARANKPDLIILDVMMNQVREGFFVSRKLEQDPGFRAAMSENYQERVPSAWRRMEAWCMAAVCLPQGNGAPSAETGRLSPGTRRVLETCLQALGFEAEPGQRAMREGIH